LVLVEQEVLTILLLQQTDQILLFLDILQYVVDMVEVKINRVLQRMVHLVVQVVVVEIQLVERVMVEQEHLDKVSQVVLVPEEIRGLVLVEVVQVQLDQTIQILVPVVLEEPELNGLIVLLTLVVVAEVVEVQLMILVVLVDLVEVVQEWRVEHELQHQEQPIVEVEVEDQEMVPQEMVVLV
jgi:hypothetical protein